MFSVAVMNRSDLTDLAVEDTRLYVMGVLNSRSFDAVVSTLVKNPEVDTLVLTAIAGSIDDDTTFKLGRWLREQGLNTHLQSNSVIASGAVDLFLAGVQRSAEHGARLGVHSWSDGSSEATDYPRDADEHALNREYISDLLGDDAFYWYTINAAPADEIHWMSPEHVEAFGLLTEPREQTSAQHTPFGEKFVELRQALL